MEMSNRSLSRFDGGDANQGTLPPSDTKERGIDMKIHYHGHSCFEIHHEGHRLIIDPFLRGNPMAKADPKDRSEEHTSELQSRENLVCRLLLEKKKKHKTHHYH